VRFDESQNVHHDSTVTIKETDEQEYFGKLWYSTEECKKIKTAEKYTRKIVCLAISCSTTEAAPQDSMGESYGGAILQVYNECCRVDKEQHLPKSPLQQELQEQIQLWATRIGLEHQVIRAIKKKDTQRRREQLLDIVAYCRFRKDDDSQSEQDECAELIRAKCQAISRPARLFALSIGMAQAP
jgi:hypothetical protein